MTTRRNLLHLGIATGAGFGLGLPNLARAQEALPAAVATEVPDARFAGSTRMRFLGLSIYDASLWVAPGFQAVRYAQTALALELRYLRSLYGKSIAERSLQEMRRAGPLPAAAEERWLAAMREAFPDVNEGDRITGILLPTFGARFYFNGQLRSTVRDTEFSRLFFGIWLSDATSEPRLRQELLSKLPA